MNVYYNLKGEILNEKAALSNQVKQLMYIGVWVRVYVIRCILF